MKSTLNLTLRGGEKRKLECPVLVGILNATPDSFYDGDPEQNPARLQARVDRMVREQIPWVDIGGESTRPGSTPVPLLTELNRVLPVIRALRKQAPDLVLSIDTTKAAVADAALAEGAHLVNDTSAGEDSDGRIFESVARHSSSILLMHRQGTPDRMQERPHYKNVVREVMAHLAARAEVAMKFGIKKYQILLDPGIGFGKTTEHNLALLTAIPDILDLGYPLMIGASMKRIIGDLTGREAGERLAGTLALHLSAARQGAHMLRLHEPWHMKDVLAVARRLGDL